MKPETNNMKIFVLLPAYNEAESIPRLFPKLLSTLDSITNNYRIIICDDGSSDNTAEIARKILPDERLAIITHKINRGLGETMRDLYEYVAENSKTGDVVIRMDCDDTHEPKYIPAMLKSLSLGYEVVIASRFASGGGQSGVTGYRATLSSAANVFMRSLFRIPGVREYSCGYRAYTSTILKKAIAFYGNDFIQLKGLGFTGTLEKLVKLHVLNAKIGEIPFHLRYDQKISSSKMISSITTLGYIIMAILYHWPWGGWKSKYRRKTGKQKTLRTV
jgi:dolichol-phosphate mannosyltransferase